MPKGARNSTVGVLGGSQLNADQVFGGCSMRSFEFAEAKFKTQAYSAAITPHEK
jgi:hypothetical protein